MKLINKITPVALATTMAFAGLAAVPSLASAEVSASLSIANMYFWRGLNLTPDAPQVAGSLDYGHDSGLYAGIWTTNEDDGHETDLYIGFAGEAGPVSYDISYWDYLYPEDGAAGEGPAIEAVSTGTTPEFVDLGDNSLAEIVASVGAYDVTATFYISQETQGGSDYTYTTLDYTYSDFNILYGFWSFDETGNDEYSHITFSYSATDNLTFMISALSSDTSPVSNEEDPLFVVSYNIPIEMK